MVERALARCQLNVNEYPDAIAGGYKSRELLNSNDIMNFKTIPVLETMEHLVQPILGAVFLAETRRSHASSPSSIRRWLP